MSEDFDEILEDLGLDWLPDDRAGIEKLLTGWGMKRVLRGISDKDRGRMVKDFDRLGLVFTQDYAFKGPENEYSLWIKPSELMRSCLSFYQIECTPPNPGESSSSR